MLSSEKELGNTSKSRDDHFLMRSLVIFSNSESPFSRGFTCLSSALESTKASAFLRIRDPTAPKDQTFLADFA
jgi:hypothetical protein